MRYGRIGRTACASTPVIPKAIQMPGEEVVESAQTANLGVR
jgi:hypothetical protein